MTNQQLHNLLFSRIGDLGREALETAFHDASRVTLHTQQKRSPLCYLAQLMLKHPKQIRSVHVKGISDNVHHFLHLIYPVRIHQLSLAPSIDFKQSVNVQSLVCTQSQFRGMQSERLEALTLLKVSEPLNRRERRMRSLSVPNLFGPVTLKCHHLSIGVGYMTCIESAPNLTSLKMRCEANQLDLTPFHKLMKRVTHLEVFYASPVLDPQIFNPSTKTLKLPQTVDHLTIQGTLSNRFNFTPEQPANYISLKFNEGFEIQGYDRLEDEYYLREKPYFCQKDDGKLVAIHNGEEVGSAVVMEGLLEKFDYQRLSEEDRERFFAYCIKQGATDYHFTQYPVPVFVKRHMTPLLSLRVQDTKTLHRYTTE